MTAEAKLQPGSVSHGTMSEDSLIRRFCDALETVDPKTAGRLREEYERLVYWQDAVGEYGADLSRDIGRIREELFHLLGAHAPKGHYFGAHPGDGSDYGFWPCEDDKS